ncbi:hypothetical protein FRC06_002210, partial [Ceratobasidium sp. 370]
MADSRDSSAPPTTVAALAEHGQRYRPYEVMPERDVSTMLSRVEEVLQHVDRVFEHNPGLFSSTDYVTLTSKYRSYRAELAEEKRSRQTPIDDIVAQSPILSVLYAIKERGLDRATALLRNVELFQSEILAAIQPSSRRNIPVVIDQTASRPGPSGSLNYQPSKTVDPETLKDQRFLTTTHSQQSASVASPKSRAVGLSPVVGAYQCKIIYENAGRRVEAVDVPFRLSSSDGLNQEIGDSSLHTVSEIEKKGWL